MAEIQTRASCINHPAELATVQCDDCATPVCAACRVEALAAHGEFCSDECKQRWERAVTDQLLPGLEDPFETGWKLWKASLGTLLAHTAPLALAMGLALWLGDASLRAADPLTASEAPFSGWATLSLVLLFAFGIGVTGTVLSQRHTGFIRGNPYVWVIMRALYWGVTWVLMIVITVAGYFLLIVPGIIAGIRFFWADEFALAHRMDPIEALKESWKLTADSFSELFKFQFFAGLVASLVAVLWFGILFVIAPLAEVHSAGMLLFWSLFFLLAFIGIGALHAAEIAKFYGMYAAQIRGVSGGFVQLGLHKGLGRR